MKPFIFSVIPARGGSKGIRNKNIRILAGKPLIQYTIEAALKSGALSDVIVSTDSPDIADLSKKLGAHVPFLRPDHLATDEASTVDVVIHAVRSYEELNGMTVDIIVLLQPTAPLRTAKDIVDSLDLFMTSHEADSLFGCYEANHVHPDIMYTKKGDTMYPYEGEGRMIRRRQELEPVYVRNGAIYMAHRMTVLEGRNLVGSKPIGYIMPRERSINIDELFDLELAESLMSRDSQR